MGKFVEYLKIFRAHTSPVTILTLVVYYFLGGGDLYSWKVIALVLLGIYFHWCGFGHNSVMDYHYDVRDPHKQHFPLVKGTVSIDEAKKVINWMMLAGIFIASFFALLYASNPLLALLCLALYVQAGHSYNDGLNKISLWKWVPESLCYMFLAGYAYFIGGSEINNIFWLGLLYLFLVVMYEIYWEGELKEIEFGDEVNILRTLGAELYVGETTGMLLLEMPLWLELTSYIINIVKLVIGFTIMCLVSSLYGILIYSIGIAVVIYYVYKLTATPRIYNHDKELEWMGNAEAFGLLFFTLSVMARDINSFLIGLILAVFSFAWYRVFNKIQWGVSKRPQV